MDGYGHKIVEQDAFSAMLHQRQEERAEAIAGAAARQEMQSALWKAEDQARHWRERAEDAERKLHEVVPYVTSSCTACEDMLARLASAKTLADLGDLSRMAFEVRTSMMAVEERTRHDYKPKAAARGGKSPGRRGAPSAGRRAAAPPTTPPADGRPASGVKAPPRERPAVATRTNAAEAPPASTAQDALAALVASGGYPTPPVPGAATAAAAQWGAYPAQLGGAYGQLPGGWQYAMAPQASHWWQQAAQQQQPLAGSLQNPALMASFMAQQQPYGQQYGGAAVRG